MRKTDLKDILETVQLVRREKYPDLDPEFLEAVVRSEEQNQEDDAEAIRGIHVALNRLLREKGTS